MLKHPKRKYSPNWPIQCLLAVQMMWKVAISVMTIHTMLLPILGKKMPSTSAFLLFISIIRMKILCLILYLVVWLIPKLLYILSFLFAIRNSWKLHLNTWAKAEQHPHLFLSTYLPTYLQVQLHATSNKSHHQSSSRFSIEIMESERTL